jgi:hypothetical protein
MAELEQVEDNPNTAYEQSDWHIGWTALAFLGIFFFLVIASVVLIGAFPRSVSDVKHGLSIEPPQPRLQTNPPDDLAQFRVDEDKQLNSYYWVDKDKGIVHIPISAAMRIVARKGIEGFPRSQP